MPKKMNMKIAIIQSDLIWENPSENRRLFNQKINAISADTDLIALPEMFTTGFSMEPKPIAERMDGDTVRWMQNLAFDRNCAITGSIVIEENNQFFNRLLFVFPDKKIEVYDKRHLFSLAGEQHKYTAGSKKLIVDYKNFKICLLICYDLRFPVFSRNTDNYDLLIYVANWPKPRIAAWDALLKARAIENMSYVVGVNRVGEDGNGHQYIGHSQAVDFMGNYVLEPQESADVFYINIDKENQNEARQKFGFLNDADVFSLI